MLFERIESEGLAQYSYIIGDQLEAVVIDPRRDCGVYTEIAGKAGYRIVAILETHRNEDFAIGSLELASQLGGASLVEIWHADGALDYQYGQPVQDGQTWQIGRLQLTALHTPGHTRGHMSYLLKDPDGNPWVVFTGDALFAGDVGRVDLVDAERIHEMGALLYETLFERLLPLGDHVIVCPAHGAGSVCGSAIAERVWTTIGLERMHNPRLQYTSREAFLDEVPRVLERPPYFRRIEKLNIDGPPVLGSLPVPTPLKPGTFAAASVKDGTVVVDTRRELAFTSAHVPGALSIWQGGLASFAGWFLPYDTPLLLVTPGDDPTPAVRALVRLGYDQIAGCLAGGLLGWHTAGRESHRIRTLTTQALCDQLDSGTPGRILDIRSDEELADEGAIADAHHIHITQLPEHLSDVPRDRETLVFCGSGLRSTLAASYLKRQGWDDVTVILGGTKGWHSIACPLEL